MPILGPGFRNFECKSVKWYNTEFAAFSSGAFSHVFEIHQLNDCSVG